MRYCLVQYKSNLLVIAEERVESMVAVIGPLRVMGSVLGMAACMALLILGSDLVGTSYSHLFSPASSPDPPKVLASSFVTSQSGTGLVHSAPAHGHEDYQSFVGAGVLPTVLRCPIDNAGRFTRELTQWSESEVSSLVGKEVLDGGITEMIRLLEKEGSLLAEEELEHRYPCDWKTKEPIIVRYVRTELADVRATPQWFADVDAVKPSAIKAMDSITFVPSKCRYAKSWLIVSAE
jgi:isoleucyl-tRNA synthetase